MPHSCCRILMPRVEWSDQLGSCRLVASGAVRCGRRDAVIYRMRTYRAVRENLPVFHDFFRTFLLPVQLRHGARLAGRWEPTTAGRSRYGCTTTGRRMSGSRRLSAPTPIPGAPSNIVQGYPP
jgi:hypothetical protein